MSEKKYYEILHIESSAERKQIHEAYKYLAKEYQYEENDLFEYISKMKELNEAYLVLSDPDDRAKYDNNDSSIDFSENEELEDEDSEQEIPVEIDEESETKYKLKVESFTAYLLKQGEIQVICEVVTKSGKASKKFITVRFSAYDKSGKLIGTKHPNRNRLDYLLRWVKQK